MLDGSQWHLTPGQEMPFPSVVGTPPIQPPTKIHTEAYSGTYFFFLSLGGITTLLGKVNVFNKCGELGNFRPEILAKRLCISYETPVTIIAQLSSVDPSDNQLPA